MREFMKKNKGFTLIELLAVIVILAVLMLIAGTNISGVMTNAKRGTFRTEFLSLLDSANTKAQVDIMNGVFKGASSKCYTIDDLADYWSNKNDYTGSVLVTKDAKGNFTFKGWMSGTEFIIEGKDSSVQSTETDAPAAAGKVASTTCK